MLRLFDLYQAASAPAAVALLIASNLVPLVGVLLWGWNLWSIIILYWIENGIVGALNIPKMLLAQGGGGSAGPAGRLGLTGFFIVHYGLFWFVHGVFVWLFLPMFGGIAPVVIPEPAIGPGALIAPGPSVAFSSIRIDVLGWGTFALLISHVVSFVLNYVGRREYMTRTVESQMFAPYARVVILHLAILFGAFLAAFLGQPIGALVILIALKTVVDLWLHLREHEAARSG